jgi:protocatechuate 3,4-dioxygenase beta subunit
MCRVSREQTTIAERGTPRAVAAVMVIALVVGGLSSGTIGVAQQGIPATATGSVRGRLLDAQSGVPIAGAQIVVAPTLCDCQFSTLSGGRTPLYHQTSRDDGSYEVDGVAPGDYLVRARGPANYLPTYFGQTSVDDPRSMRATGTVLEIPIRIRAGEVTPDVDLRMDRRSTITGRIVDRRGEPIPSMDVDLLRKVATTRGGRPPVVAFDQTDPQGVFRMDVPPGEYYIRAYPSDAARPRGAGAAAAYASTFFPGVRRLEQAQTISIRAGQESSGHDFAVGTVTTTTVSGRLVDAGGPPLSQAVVELTRVGIGLEGERPSAAVRSDGRFEIRGVVRDDYVLTVVDPADVRRWIGVRRPITVAGAVSGLEIAADRGVRVSGRLVTDDGTPPPFAAMGVQLLFEYIGAGAATTDGGRVEKEGVFALDLPAGTALLRVSNLPSPWIVRAVRLDGADITDRAANLRRGTQPRVDVAITDRSGTVGGAVTDGTARVMAYAPVVVFPDDRSRWTAPRLTRIGYSQHDGSFEISSLPPADYRVVAVDRLPRDAWQDPQVLERLWPRATPLVVREGDRQRLALTALAASDVIR